MNWENLGESLILTLPGIVVALITVGPTVFAARLKARNAKAVTDAEVGAQIREELRGELERLKARMKSLREANDECEDDRERLHRDVARLNSQMVRLEDRLRGTPPSEGRRKA